MSSKTQGAEAGSTSGPARPPSIPISPSLDETVSLVRRMVDRCSDVVVREFETGQQPYRTKGALLYTEGLVSLPILTDAVVGPLLFENRLAPVDGGSRLVKRLDMDDLQRLLVAGSDLRTTADLRDAVDRALMGDSVVFLDGEDRALIVSTKSFEHREVDQLVTEKAVVGSHDSFVEALRVNTAQLRRRIVTPDFKMEALRLGRYSTDNIVVAYIDGLVNPEFVATVKSRLARWDVDCVTGIGHLEELITDRPGCLFPLAEITERPDEAAAGILEGRVCVLLDNSPFVMVLPATLLQVMVTIDDYQMAPWFASFVRLMRFGALLVSLLLVPLYVAVIDYDQELIPTPLLQVVVAAREKVPFPTVVEVLVMLSIVEVLKEAGVRIPGTAGPAVAIIGAIVTGDAAIRASLASPVTVIAVGIAAITSFAIPDYKVAAAVRVFQFALFFAAAVLGFFGLALASVALVAYVTSLDSLGVPYTAPVAPRIRGDRKDFIVRVPWPKMVTRPSMLSPLRRFRTSSGDGAQNGVGRGNGSWRPGRGGG